MQPALRRPNRVRSSGNGDALTVSPTAGASAQRRRRIPPGAYLLGNIRKRFRHDAGRLHGLGPPTIPPRRRPGSSPGRRPWAVEADAGQDSALPPQRGRPRAAPHHRARAGEGTESVYTVPVSPPSFAPNRRGPAKSSCFATRCPRLHGCLLRSKTTRSTLWAFSHFLPRRGRPC